MVKHVLIFAMTFLSVTIVSGIGSLAPRLWDTIDGNSNEYLEFLAKGIEGVSYVFPVFFIIVTAMVVFMTIKRMIAVKRSQIGCLMSLGFSKWQVIKGYLGTVALVCSLGAILGVIFGYYVISPVLFTAISGQLGLPNNVPAPFPLFGVIAGIITILISVATVLVACFKILKEHPSTILRPIAKQRQGKPLIERIKIVKIIPFGWRAPVRNVFLFKFKFFMIVFGVVFSCALVFAGISLPVVLNVTNPEIMTFIRPISVVIILAAVLLNAMVIYNITNINIEERQKEIATLRVLGYHNIEVCNYVFREILITTIIGVIIGLPLGYGFMAWLFDFLAFGGIQHLQWYVWIVTGVLTIASLGLAVLLLYRKIIKTDMNASLKFYD